VTQIENIAVFYIKYKASDNRHMILPEPQETLIQNGHLQTVTVISKMVRQWR
jgi:hypothetical protein